MADAAAKPARAAMRDGASSRGGRSAVAGKDRLHDKQ